MRDLIARVRPSSLRALAAALEAHDDSCRICALFREFLSDFGRVFKTPVLFSEIGANAGQRAVQAALAAEGSVRLSEIERRINWMSDVEVNALIVEGVRCKLYKCRIDMMRDTINVLE